MVLPNSEIADLNLDTPLVSSPARLEMNDLSLFAAVIELDTVPAFKPDTESLYDLIDLPRLATLKLLIELLSNPDNPRTKFFSRLAAVIDLDIVPVSISETLLL